MQGQWYSHGWIVNGKTLYVGGPIKFDKDEVGAEVVVEGTVEKDGSTAPFTSALIDTSTPNVWVSWACEVNSQAKFTPGKADGKATAKLTRPGGPDEKYPWENLVMLE